MSVFVGVGGISADVDKRRDSLKAEMMLENFAMKMTVQSMAAFGLGMELCILIVNKHYNFFLSFSGQ